MPKAKKNRSALPGEAIRDCKGGKPKLIRTGEKRWSDRSEAVFLDTLATTCNVIVSAEAAGFSSSSAYQRRRRNPGFGERWQQALELGYERLEARVLEYAEQSFSGAPIKPGEKMTIGEAIQILKIYRGTVKDRVRLPGRRPARPRTFEDFRASIVRKLEAIERNRARR